MLNQNSHSAVITDYNKDGPFKHFKTKIKVIKMSMYVCTNFPLGTIKLYCIVLYAMHVYCHEQFECHSLNIVRGFTIRYHRCIFMSVYVGV